MTTKTQKLPCFFLSVLTVASSFGSISIALNVNQHANAQSIISTSRRSTTENSEKSSQPKRRKQSTRRKTIEKSKIPTQGEDEDDFQKARDWFLYQRAYPFDSIPTGARERAWKSSRLIRATTISAPSTSPSWQPLGPLPFISGTNIYTGHIQVIKVSPVNSNLVLVGSVAGGIWRSTDGGDTFVPVSDDQVDLEVGSIDFSPSNPQIVYAAMGGTTYGSFLGTGVLKSTDAGLTWHRASNSTLPTPGASSKILVDPADSNRVYLAQYSGSMFSSGFWISTDGGVNWRNTLPGLTVDHALHPANPQTLYLSMALVGKSGNPKPGLYRSTDKGETWTFLFSGPFDVDNFPTFRIGLAPANSQIAYLFGAGTIAGVHGYRIFASSDGGTTWTDRNAAGLQQYAADYITVDPINSDTVFIGQFDVIKSTNGGSVWSALLPGQIHVDQHCFAFTSSTGNSFLAGGDGGLYRTNDGGASFQALNDTLSLAQFYGLTLHPFDPLATYGGTQDNGTAKRVPESLNWRVFAGGDGGPTVVDPIDPRIVFVIFQNGGIWRLRNNGDSFDAVAATTDTFGEATNHRIAFIPPFTGNGLNSKLYFGTWRLFVSTNLENTWTAPAGNMDLTKGANDVLSVVSVAPSDLNTIYTGSAQGRSMVSTDGCTSWTDITPGLPNRFITSIKIDRLNSSVAYLSVSGYGSPHIFKTTTKGASWVNISSNLPDIPTGALLIDPTNSGIVYAGTDIGVFRSTTGGTQWDNFNNGMPPVPVFGMAARPGGLIRLVTHGRGAFELTTNGQPITNSVDDSQFFVRQHYQDYLNRQPDSDGLGFWINEIAACGLDVHCVEVKRINVSAAFFLSIEFQETGYLVYRIYKSAFVNLPGAPVPVRLVDFLRDTQQIGNGVQVGIGDWQNQLENNKQAFAMAYVQRSDFQAAYPNTLTAEQFVTKVDTNAGGVLSPTEKINLAQSLSSGPNDFSKRAVVLRAVAEDIDLRNAEFNKAFVLMQYFGYLRRNPNDLPDSDFSGYNFWLNKLNSFGGNFVDAEMVKAFIVSGEYRQRFGV